VNRRAIDYKQNFVKEDLFNKTEIDTIILEDSKRGDIKSTGN
jgi:hypothetical protein